jgi:hypothetical protein
MFSSLFHIVQTPSPAFCDHDLTVIYMKSYDNGCQRILVYNCLAKLSVKVKMENILYKVN